MPSTIELKPIGYFQGPQTRPYLLPRQSGPLGVEGCVVLDPNLEAGLRDLEGFDTIWLLFAFDRAKEEKLLVQPPGQTQKRGVFATRSPHRPNHIGMSAVKLQRIDGARLFVRDCDLLDGTPILDIKPYIIRADSHPNASQGWRSELCEYTVCFLCEADIKWVFTHGGPDLQRAALNVLSLMPHPSHHNRISQTQQGYVWACQTWRLHFTLDEKERKVRVQSLSSGYSDEELNGPDRWGDLQLHKAFLAR